MPLPRIKGFRLAAIKPTGEVHPMGSTVRLSVAELVARAQRHVHPADDIHCVAIREASDDFGPEHATTAFYWCANETVTQ